MAKHRADRHPATVGETDPVKIAALIRKVQADHEAAAEKTRIEMLRNPGDNK